MTELLPACGFIFRCRRGLFRADRFFALLLAALVDATMWLSATAKGSGYHTPLLIELVREAGNTPRDLTANCGRLCARITDWFSFQIKARRSRVQFK